MKKALVILVLVIAVKTDFSTWNLSDEKTVD